MTDLPTLIPPFGASTVIVFFCPDSATGRPWNVIAGHLGSALVAVATMACLADFPVGLQAAIAVAGAGVWMAMSRSIHPPGGATALLATLAGQGGRFLLPLFAGCLALISIRWVIDKSIGAARTSTATAESQELGLERSTTS